MTKLSLFQRVDRWLNPYLYGTVAMQVIDNYKNPSQKTKGMTKQEVVDSDITALNIQRQLKPFTASESIVALENEPFDNGWYFHNDRYHQLTVKYDKGSGKRYQARNGGKRQKIKKDLLLFPKVPSYDMTHLHNVGFHGSDSDLRLLVGWNSDQNRKSMRLFEEEIVALNQKKPIFWYVSIELQDDYSAKWNSVVYDLDGVVVLEKSFHDTANFKWFIEDKS